MLRCARLVSLLLLLAVLMALWNSAAAFVYASTVQTLTVQVANAASALSFVLKQNGGIGINSHLYLPNLRQAE